jgi:hypothetical protein
MKDEKDQQKELDEQEAKRRGISYKEVRQERRRNEKKKDTANPAAATTTTHGSVGAASTKRKTKSMADALETSEHEREVKRMRTYSTTPKKVDEERKGGAAAAAATTTMQQQQSEPISTTAATSRPRTRSIDLKAVHQAQISDNQVGTISEWQQLNSITIRQHGNGGGVVLPDPYRTFAETPFAPKVLELFTKAGFVTPTAIQAQAWPIAIQTNDMICVAKTGSGST